MTQPNDCTGAGTPDVPRELKVSEAAAADPAAQADHLVACNPCGDALDTLKTQRDALVFLSTSHARTGPRSRIERVLTASAHAGREKLADLLYELAKACLVQLPEFRLRVERLVEPREADRVTEELKVLGLRVGLGQQLEPRAEWERTLRGAERSLSILENVEGRSSRHQLAMSQFYVFQGEPDRAESLLRSLLETEIPPGHRSLAFRNLLQALNRQEKYSVSAALGLEAVQAHSDDVVLWHNYAVAVSHLGLKERFQDIGETIAELVRAGVSPHALGLLENEVEGFAEDLGTTVGEVRRTLGLVGGVST